MFTRKLIIFCVAIPFAIALLPAKTEADSLSDFYTQGAAAAQQAQWQRWNSYTPRQRQLASAIGDLVYDYYQKTGQPLPITENSFSLVMDYLKAEPSEADFVYDRLLAQNSAIGGIDRADGTINQMQNFLGCLQTQGTGCVP